MNTVYSEVYSRSALTSKYLPASVTNTCAAPSAAGEKDYSQLQGVYHLTTASMSLTPSMLSEILRLLVIPKGASLFLGEAKPDPWLNDLRQLGVAVQQQDEVSRYLTTYPDIAKLVPRAVDAIRKHIPNAHLLLDVYSDPEIDDRYLVLYVRVPVYDEAFMARIEEAEAEYIEQLSNSTGWLQLTTDFQPPETIDAL